MSIQLSLDGLSFAIRDYLSNSYIHFEHAPQINLEVSVDKIKKALAPIVSHAEKYKKVFLVIDESRLTSHPATFSEQKERDAFFNLNHQLGNNEKVVNFGCNKKVPCNSFAFRNDTLSYFKEQFANISIMHFTDVIIWNSLAFHQDEAEHLSLSIFKNHFYLTATKGQKVVLNNSSVYSTQADLLFLVLNTLTKLGFDQYKASVKINGNIERSADIIKELKRFIKDVSFEEWPAAFNFNDAFFKMPPFHYSTLFLAPLCE